jgi:hypothetical protein
MDRQTLTTTSSTSTPALSADLSAARVALVEALFERLSATLGSSMLTLYAGIPPAAVKHEWAEALAGFSIEEIKRGLAATRTNRYAPNLPEFLHRCRPSLDDETAWHEAALAVSGDPRTFAWSHEAVRRASQNFNFELRTRSYRECRARWASEMSRQWARFARGGTAP